MLPELYSTKIKMDSSWRDVLRAEFTKPYMANLKKFLIAEKKAGKIVYPKGEEYFTALNTIPFEDVKVVIIGQDPYHGPGQAHGLCFSVRPGVGIPPSLVNIFKELKSDLGVNPPDHGYLLEWAKQGVLLLNAVLTVQAGLAASHQKRGWEEFTDAIVHSLNDQREGLVFVLWGSYAQKKGAFIDRQKHFVIEGPHPSPLSAHRGFFGSKPFSKINAYLKSRHKKEINWNLKLLSQLAQILD
jgi:uracil-DNA glycosylase